MVRAAKGQPQLPKKQLLILSLCRFAEPVAMTSVFPYIPEMIQSFDVPTDQVAKWAGLMSAAFSLSQCLTGIAWGRASDRLGRKPMILLALTCTMMSSVLFGFSQSLAMAFVARSLQGLSNGNVGIIRTAVAELVPQKELQPRAFSIMPLVWTVGSIFGPAFGGSLVHPVERYPGIFRHLQIFKQYPFALPNVIISILFMVGITSGFLFLRESLDEKKSRRDYGLLLGSLLTGGCRKRARMSWRRDTQESEPFITGNQSELSTPASRHAPHLPRVSAGWSQVFTRQSNINLVVYTFLAMHSVAFDQLLPIFMHHPVQSSKDSEVHLPFKFSGGFGIDSNRIGLLFTIYGTFGMVIQFAIFPPFARRYGVLNCLKGCSLAFPLVYIATPFTALLPTDNLRQGVMLLLMLMKGFCAIFAFPCSTILLTNSATSLKILGTLNGVSTSISAIGRAAGPALAGATFTGGVDVGYVIISWWTLATVAIIGAFPVWWLVEMEGFGSRSGNNDDDDDDDDDEDEDHTSVKSSDDSEDGISKTSSLGDAHVRKSSPVLIENAIGEADDEDANDMFEQSALLTRSNTRGSQGRPRRASRGLDRIPSPIGMGKGVAPPGSRRYSSDLGTTRSGLGTGGTSYH